MTTTPTASPELPDLDLLRSIAHGLYGDDLCNSSEKIHEIVDSVKVGSEMGDVLRTELIELLQAIRPKYGAVGSRDVDVTAQRERIDRAIVLLSIPNGEQAAALGAHALYAWLPLEPTEAMVHAAEDLPVPRMFGKVWRAMASAGPCAPIQMILHCPACGVQHIDAPDERTEAWGNPPHRSHLCHGCGHIWRPADVATEGVAAIQTRGSNDSPATTLSPLCGAQHAESRKDGELGCGGSGKCGFGDLPCLGCVNCPSEDDTRQADAKRLMFAMQDIDGFVGIKQDKYDLAVVVMEERGLDEPDEECELEGVRRLIDKAIQRAAQLDGGQEGSESNG